MTKKHFIALAEAIKMSDVDNTCKLFAARVVIRVSQADNPRFDAGRFLRACGLGEWA